MSTFFMIWFVSGLIAGLIDSFLEWKYNKEPLKRSQLLWMLAYIACGFVTVSFLIVGHLRQNTEALDKTYTAIFDWFQKPLWK